MASPYLPLTTPRGTMYASFKSALMDNLSVRSGLSNTVVQYEAPYGEHEIQNDSGDYEIIFWDDTGTGTGIGAKTALQENTIICSIPLEIDEEFPIPLCVQVFKPDRGQEGSQEAADHRVDELIYEIYKEIASNPSQGLHGSPGVRHIRATKIWAFERRTGYLTEYQEGHGSMARLYIYVQYRMHFLD